MEVLFKERNVIYNILCVLIAENEKLFDRSDCRLYWRTVLHIFAIYHHYYIAVFSLGINLEKVLDMDIVILKRFRPAYLTGWNFAFQTCFLTLALIYDALEWSNKHDSTFAKKIKYFRDIIFCSMVVPYTLFVTIMFWCVYWIDRELVFPRVFDDIVPWWFNHCVHTNITVMIIIETLLQPRRQPTNKKLELFINATVAVGYAVVYFSIFFFTGHWLYKVFGVMTWWQVCLYQLFNWCSSYLYYIMQFPINRFIHGSIDDEDQETTAVENQSDNHNSVEPVKINGIENNGLPKNGHSSNGLHNGNSNGLQKNGNLTLPTDLQLPPFSTKSWSLKYRNLRSQFENTKL